MSNLPNDALLQLFYQASSDAIIFTNEQGLILATNPSAEQFFGYNHNELMGKPIEILMPNKLRKQHVSHREQYYAQPTPRPMGTHLQLYAKHKKGHALAIDISLSPLKNENNELIIVASVRDISTKRKLEEKLSYMANHDPLTGLIHLETFKDQLNLEIHHTEQLQQCMALFMIDIDDFKLINDHYGHDMGNELLIAFSQRLTQSIRKQDLVSRTGGDEFMCLIQNVKDHPTTQKIAHQLQQNMSKPFNIYDFSLSIQISLGISVYPTHATDAKTLMTQADKSMYYVKNTGKNNVAFYDQQMQYPIQSTQTKYSNRRHIIKT